jgi:hypothetical protein
LVSSHSFFSLIKLSFNINTILVILIFLLLAAFSYYIYRVTIPKVSNSKKWFLIGLRSLAFIAIVSMFFEPLLTIINKTEEPPILCVLIDNSGSLTLTDKLGEREKTLREILKSNMFNNIPGTGKIQFCSFSDKLKTFNNFTPDSIDLKGNITDISKALKSIKNTYKEENLQGVLLITDGEYNTGQNPIYQAENLNMPIYTLGIGDSSEQKDLAVTKIVTNNLVYKGTKVPVQVGIKSSGFGNETIDVGLYEEKNLIDSKKLTLREGTFEYPVELTFEPKEEGIKKYSISISRLSGEITEKNNSRNFFVKVLKNRIKVLLISGSPSADASFIKNSILADKNLELKTLIQKPTGDFYEGVFSKSSMDSVECVVLTGFPVSNTKNNVIDELRNQVMQRNIPLFFIPDISVDYGKLRVLEPLLPFITSPQISTNEIMVSINILPNQIKNPILKITNSESDLSLWNKLPPIFRTETVYRIKPESEILANYQINNISFTNPLLVSRKLYKQKSIALLGYGFWRWKLLGEGLESNNNLFNTFMENSLKWLTTREEDKFLQVSTDKEFYNYGDNIGFQAQLYNESYEPVDNGKIRISIAGKDKTTEIDLNSIGLGRYEGFIEGLNEGDYKYQAKAELNGKQLSEVNGRFSIGEANMEFQNTRMNAQLLKLIAAKTNGNFYSPKDYNRIIDDIKNTKNFVTREVIHKSEIRLWNLYYLLAFIILLLAFEWFIRKRSGML